HAGNGTPMLGNHTQLPTTTGDAQDSPHAGAARLTLAHESAHAADGTRTTATAAAAATRYLLTNSTPPKRPPGRTGRSSARCTSSRGFARSAPLQGSEVIMCSRTATAPGSA